MKKRKLFKRIVTAICAGVLCFVTLVLPLLSASPKTVSADTNGYVESINDLDSTPVIEDLGADYVSQFDGATSGEPKLHSFQEYCYSEKASVRNTKYGLYVYLYNPSRAEYETGSAMNVLNMATSYNSAGNPDGYANFRLKVCGYTEGKYDKLFYKFRVIGLQDVLANAVDFQTKSGQRRYDVASIQLRAKGSTSATDYGIAKTFLFSGFSKGLGVGAENESTLVCKDSQMDVLSLEVKHTTYRPEGTNGNSDYTKDSLHSVWFSVPNEMIDKYGEMSAIRATWREAVLKPALVTGYLEAFNAIKPYLGKYEKDGHIDDLGYFSLGAHDTFESSTSIIDAVNIYGELFFNAPDQFYIDGWAFTYDLCSIWHEKVSSYINPLYLMFYSGEEENSADNYYVDSETIKNAMVNANFGGVSVNGKYSSNIFSSVADDFTVADITSEETRQLFSQTKIEQGFFEKLFGKTPEYKSQGLEDKDIYAIHKVLESDLTGSQVDIVNNLYINEKDYDSLVSDFNTAKSNNETVYLFRFATSEYFAQEATIFQKTDKGVWSNDEYYWKELGTNAYYFTEKVFLDFEIIHVEFTKDEVKTIIPVVMSPIDIIPSSEPPVETNPDEKDKDWWEDLFPDWDELVGKFQKILLWTGIIIGAIVLLLIISKIRDRHMRTQTYKNTKPRRRK